jgi:hypothetical protein
MTGTSREYGGSPPPVAQILMPAGWPNCSVRGSRLNSPAATHSRGDGRGDHRSLRDRSASRCDGGGDDGRLGDRSADDAHPANA